MQKVYTVRSDLSGINEGDLSKLSKYHSYFFTYEEALSYLLLIKLENVVDDYRVKDGYSKPLNKLEKIALQIRELEKKKVIEQEKLYDFNVHGLRVAPSKGVFY
jgi:hypothetical protein